MKKVEYSAVKAVLMAFEKYIKALPFSEVLASRPISYGKESHKFFTKL